MNGYSGDFLLGATLDLKFTTVNTAGVPTTLAGTPVVSVYVGNGTTEITAGITLSVDFDGKTGLHNIRVVASGGNGFAAQTDVTLVVTTGTVDGASVVGYVVGSFSIENRSSPTAVAIDALIVAALASDTYAEPTGVPPATDTLANKLGRIHMALRNGLVIDTTTGKKQFQDDGGATEWEKDFTDVGGVYTESEANAP